MKIVNIDAHKELVEKVQSLMIPRFILDVIKPLEEKYYGLPASCQMVDSFSCDDYSKDDDHSKVSLPTCPIRMFYYKVVGYENIATLVHTIPIYLRNDNTKSDETGIIETLGAYHPNLNKNRNDPNKKGNDPYIELFLFSINKECDIKGIPFKWLFTIILLHELAHAALDIHNIKGYENTTEQVSYSSVFGRWREESMANAVALRIIKDYGDEKFSSCAEEFMLTQEKQPQEYAFGVKLVDFDYWDFRSNIECKINGVDKKTQDDWMEYVEKGNPDLEGWKVWNEKLIYK